ncbi:hypothetical protein A3A79_04570 [Candidatus Gottesmanbacteria bacterium RIFCSPLOWO2_01_FULL_43_11b]|uniref:HEPN domain-containing protein n=1 Tax=Candidatus Gottesmanbacteria bacterium RIFCSPLOWO2_01_FULL_43_11b TaxID=1798392 RepID=A0A1F6AI79_9BACT|nr:MAG: hypothetical protein A3A79_04570 [Candidatus Gottesmanbacteria bacterium RIFCSPLOWO2_01_FULL_43_11b]
MKNQQLLAALAMDLRRAALGYHRGSLKMAKRFLEEALKRREQIDAIKLKPYLRKYLMKVDGRSPADAEELLTYSIVFQNAATIISPRA